MELKDYCKNVDTELSQWHDRLGKIVSHLDAMPTRTKEALYEEVNGLHILMDEMDDRINQLRTQCSISWEPEEDSPTPTIAGTSKRFNDTPGLAFDYDFGG